VLREPLLARIPSSRVLVSDSDSRSYHPVGDHIMPERRVNTPPPPSPLNFYLMLCWSSACEPPGNITSELR